MSAAGALTVMNGLRAAETTFVIIDPQTGNVLGSETVAQTPVAGAAPGTVLFYSATTSARWTSQLPPPTP